MFYELTPHFANVKSFYGKAQIIEDENYLTLKSYNTLILKIDKTTRLIKWLCKNADAYTLTTNRHINEFLQQQGQDTLTRQEILKLAEVI